MVDDIGVALHYQENFLEYASCPFSSYSILTVCFECTTLMHLTRPLSYFFSQKVHKGKHAIV